MTQSIETKEEIKARTKYRVTLICKCRNDYAEGYGPTIAEADASALRWFRKHHGRTAKPEERIAEHAVEHDALGGSHYEEIA